MTFKPTVSQIRIFSMICLPLSRANQNSMSEAEIIDWAHRSNWLTQSERESVPSRSDSRFANIIHNIVSHRQSRKNPIRLGLITYDGSTASFSLTQRGLNFLNNVASKIEGDAANAFDAINRWLKK